MASSIARTATLFQKLLSGRHVTYRSLEQQEDINRRTALRWIKEAKHVFGDALKEDRLDSGEKSFWLDSRRPAGSEGSGTGCRRPRKWRRSTRPYRSSAGRGWRTR